MQNLLIRADANSNIGTGHIMRCLAIAQAWRSVGGRVWFAAASVPDAIYEQLRIEGFETINLNSNDDPQTVVGHAVYLQASHIVLDGQRFDSDYQCEIKQARLNLLVLDDYGEAGHYYADCVVNSDLVLESLYDKREPYTHLFLGPSYALLRSEFKRTNKTPESTARNVRVLITMGGSDPQNMTLTALQAIERIQAQNVEFRVIVGAANSRFEALQKFAKKILFPIEVMKNVGDMPAQMQWADVAIVAAGVSLWELLYMGVAVTCWPRYRQDVQVLEELSKRGAVLPLNLDADADAIAKALTRLLTDLKLRHSLQLAGSNMVDGQGAKRVVEIFSQLAATSPEGIKAH